MKKLLFNYILPPFAFIFLYVWCATLRTRNLNPELEKEIRSLPGKGILVLWHSQLFYYFYYFRGLRELSILISPSTDGDLLARICGLMGYNVVRASSFKKTMSGSRELIKILKSDSMVGIIADGSRGPRHKAQAGSIQLARITGAALYPMAYDAQTKYEFNSWDRLVLPLPFSRVTLNFGPTIIVPRDADKQNVEQMQEELNQTLHRITEACTTL